MDPLSLQALTQQASRKLGSIDRLGGRQLVQLIEQVPLQPDVHLGSFRGHHRDRSFTPVQQLLQCDPGNRDDGGDGTGAPAAGTESRFPIVAGHDAVHELVE